MSNKIEEKVVVITGASSGLGEATARLLCVQGASVVLAGHKVGPGFAVYAATKFAVRALSEGMRQEVKPYNIRTTVISPGAVATELLNSITEPDVAETVRKRG